MNASQLSRITWTVDDRRAWIAAYADARRIARVRARRDRTERERHAVCQDPACDGYGRPLIGGLCDTVSRHSVHADTFAVRESARDRDDRFFQAQERGTL